MNDAANYSVTPISMLLDSQAVSHDEAMANLLTGQGLEGPARRRCCVMLLIVT
jgi:hypothetical protein